MSETNKVLMQDNKRQRTELDNLLTARNMKDRQIEELSKQLVIEQADAKKLKL